MTEQKQLMCEWLMFLMSTGLSKQQAKELIRAGRATVLFYVDALYGKRHHLPPRMTGEEKQYG